MAVQIGTIDDEFLQALSAEDELGAVLRAHILIESQVNAIVEKMLVDPEKLPRLRFEQTVRLMIALGVKEELSKPLIELGRIRNAFGHRIDTRLTVAMIDKWISCFSEDDRGMMERAIANTCVQVGKPLATLKDHPPKGMFVLIAVFLRQVLRQLQGELNATVAT